MTQNGAEPFRASCFTDQERALWDAANDLSNILAKSPCVDCIPSFCEEMRRQDRCNGEPGVSFRGASTDDPRVIERRRQWREAQRRKTLNRVAVAVQ